MTAGGPGAPQRLRAAESRRLPRLLFLELYIDARRAPSSCGEPGIRKPAPSPTSQPRLLPHSAARVFDDPNAAIVFDAPSILWPLASSVRVPRFARRTPTSSVPIVDLGLQPFSRTSTIDGRLELW